MPTKSKSRLTINLNLLKPQSNPQKLPVRLFAWLLSSGRYIFAVVNALVLIAFVTRFKLDADLTSKNEAITEQIPYIDSLRPYELMIRETQLKLSTIDNVRKNAFDWQLLLKKIADQVPTGMTLTNITAENHSGSATVHISGQTQSNSDIANFLAGLKGDNAFNDVNLANIGLEQGAIKFAIDAQSRMDTQSRLETVGGNNL